MKTDEICAYTKLITSMISHEKSVQILYGS